MVNTKSMVEISEFSSSCDELLSGKFIFAINKIDCILKSISNSDELFGLFSDCLKDFNYAKELAHAKQKLPTKKGTFIVPQTTKNMLALTFCILVDIQEGNIELKSFLKDYFDDQEVDEFDNFCEKLIKPFKKAVLLCAEELKHNSNFSLRNQNAQNEKNEEEQQKKDPNEVFQNIVAICEAIIDGVLTLKKGKEEAKEDCVFVANKIIEACLQKNVNQICLLTTAMKYIMRNLKKVYFLYQELEETTYDFFE